MNRSRKALAAAVALVPLLAGGFIYQERATQNSARLFDQVLGLVSERFVDSVQTGALYEKAARGLLHELKDPYSELYTPKQLAQFTQNTGGRYGGLGMQIEEVQGRGISVSKVFPNTPAERAGVQAGDFIVGIDTVVTRGWKNTQVSEALKGEPGTQVTVRFARAGVTEPIVAKFTRAIIHIPAVPYTLTFNDNIGYIPLAQFNETAGEEISKAVLEQQARGAKGLVLDLRENPGGYLEQALAISNLFLQPGQEILSVRGRGAPSQTYVARGKPIAPTIPIVILTDERTASAAEIVAGALQDHDRALIIGTTSFGKGLVQTLFNLDGGYAVKLTTAKWYTPVGRSIQKERKLTDDGQFVEVYPDSVPADSVKKLRPEYRSDAGRVVYGGGAITPDIIVQPDTLTTAEQTLARTLAPRGPDYFAVLAKYAYDLKPTVQPGFAVSAAWRDTLYSRLQTAGVAVDRATWNAGAAYIDRQLGNEVARRAFGDSTIQRRGLKDDPQLRKALEVLDKGQTQRDLFALVPANSPSKP